MIKDGTGKGYLAKVDSKNRLRCYVVIEDEASYINRIEKESYSVTFSGAISASSADNFVFYIKNTHDSKDMVIKRIKHRCSGDNGTVSFWLNVSGTPGGSLTTITPSNRNAISNNAANCTVYKSSNITGLSGGRQVGSVFGKDGEEFEMVDPCSGFIIPPNGVFALKVNNTTASHYGGVSIYFRDVE